MLFFCVAAWELLSADPAPCRGGLARRSRGAGDGVLATDAAHGPRHRRCWRNRGKDLARPGETAVDRGVARASGGGAVLYGVVMFFTGDGAESYGRVKTFGTAGLSFFRSADDPMYGLLVNLVSLQG